jgi:hypothetical protein
MDLNNSQLNLLEDHRVFHTEWFKNPGLHCLITWSCPGQVLVRVKSGLDIFPVKIMPV